MQKQWNAQDTWWHLEHQASHAKAMEWAGQFVAAKASLHSLVVMTFFWLLHLEHLSGGHYGFLLIVL